MRLLLCCFVGFFLLLAIGCKNKERESYGQIEQVIHLVDSVGYPNYQQPIALRQQALGMIKSFLALYPENEHKDTLEALHGRYFAETEKLLAEQADFTTLKQQVLQGQQSNVELVKQAMTELTAFTEKYPRCPMQNELKDMNLFLQFLNNIQYAMPEDINSLYDVNTYIDQSKVLYEKIINPEYSAPIQQLLNVLETKRIQICEKEIVLQVNRMKSEMQTYANGFFRQQCRCLQLPEILRKLGGIENYEYTVKDTSRTDSANEVRLQHVFEYKAPHGFLCKNSYIFNVMVTGVVQKTCETGITYAIEPALVNEPVPVE